MLHALNIIVILSVNRNLGFPKLPLGIFASVATSYNFGRIPVVMGPQEVEASQVWSLEDEIIYASPRGDAL